MFIIRDTVTMSASVKKNEKPAAAEKAHVFLVAGSDEFEVSRRARQLADTLCPEADRALGLEIIEAACDTVDESLLALKRVLEAVRTVGFFGSSKVVWLRDASFLHDSRPGQSAAVKEQVAELTEELKRGLLPDVRLLVSAPQIDKRTSFFKTIEKSGRVEFFDLPEKSYKWNEHAESVLRALFTEHGLKASPDVYKSMIDRAGPFTRQLHQEVEKLVLYLRDRKDVTVADVIDIVSPAREHGYGELADAFGRQDLAGALRIARRLIEQKEQAVGLIIGLQSRVRELIMLRMSLAQRWARLTGSDQWPKIEWVPSATADEFFSRLANDPRRINPYWGGMLAQQAMKFSIEQLQSIQQQLVDAHGQMTDGSAPAEFLLEWVLIKTLGAKRHAAA